jgi:hypothetical protein
MSHLGRIVSLVIVTLASWLLAYGAVGTVAASASASSPSSTSIPIDPPVRCC